MCIIGLRYNKKNYLKIVKKYRKRNEQKNDKTLKIQIYMANIH